MADGTLGGDFNQADRADLQSNLKAAEESARDEVWGSYRFAVIYESTPQTAHEADGLRVIDLGAGHSSSGETLCGRVIAALKSEALLNESVGASYLERNWPPALKESGAWPLASLRQSFLNGSLTRLLDPDMTLRGKIVEFVGRGDFGLASGQNADGTYERLWFKEPVPADEIAFESGVVLLTKAKAQALKASILEPASGPEPQPSLPLLDAGPSPLSAEPSTTQADEPEPQAAPSPRIQTRTLRIAGPVPPELWNRLGTKLLAKLRSVVPAGGQGADLQVSINISVTVNSDVVGSLTSDLRQILDELELADKVRIDLA